MKLKKIKLSNIALSPIELKHITIGEDDGLVCRNVSNFDGSTSYIEFDNDIVLSGGFKLSIWFFANDTGGAYERAILGSSSTSTIISALSDGRIKLVADTSYAFAAGSFNLGEWNYLEVEVSVGFISVTLNSVVIRNEAFSDQLTLNLVGDSAANPSRYFNGKIKDLIVELNSLQLIELPMDESINPQTGNVDYINRTGNTDYNATGYNITVTEECSEIPPESNNLTYNNGADNVTFDNGNDNVVY